MKLKAYGIFQKFKNGKLMKQLPVGVSYNYESATPDKDKPLTAVVGISGSKLFYNKKLALKEAAELNLLWKENSFVVKKININLEEN